MVVMVGSARSDENGKAHSGKAGDQKKGKEVSTQAWYLHSKGWRVLRPVDPQAAEKAAHAMQLACDSPLIGYDQWQRDTLFKAVSGVGFDIAKLEKAVETDCSALIRVCEAYAYGGDIITGTARFSTANMCGRMLKTGLFVELTGDQYTRSPDRLRRGDVLCTKTQGHVVMVLSDGAKAYDDARKYKLGDRLLRNGCEGADVEEMQRMLLQLGFDLGSWGADGDFGDATEAAVEEFQTKNGHLLIDGIVGPLTLEALEAALAELDKPLQNPIIVRIDGGKCWVRTEPNRTAARLGVVKKGERLWYGGQTSEDGWLKVEYAGKVGWVSGKYGRLEGTA